MAVSPEAVAFARELFSGLGEVAARRMFGGAGLYAEGAMFALLAGDAIYLKADDALSAAMEREGSEPFVYQGKSSPVRLGYWRLPDAALDEPEAACAWARRALDVALAKRR